MTIIKSLFISFSIYSTVPVPQFAWNEKDMRYTLCFFPWVGAFIGAILWGWMVFSERFALGRPGSLLIAAAIPIVVTGGFHMDGFMDTADAFHSYLEREEKLRILKDPHIGAFSVIMLVAYELIYIAAFSEITTKKALAVFCVGFVLSRILSGIGVVSFPSAKKDGLLYFFADSAHERVVKISLYGQMILCFGFMAWLDLWTAVAVSAAAIAAFVYYRWRSVKELGGITGDTAGYFVTLCEAAMAVAAAVGSRIVL